MENAETIKAELAQTPWCAKLLADPAFVADTQPPGRRTKPEQRTKPGREDSLLAHSLNSKDTVSRYVSFTPSSIEAGVPISELRAIAVLGQGMNGFPGTLHGGIVATLLDEITGLLITVNLKQKLLPPTSWMTAYLNTTFVKPVRTPSTVLLVARMGKRDGRKLFLSATIENGDGLVLAKGEALFIGLRQRL